MSENVPDLTPETLTQTNGVVAQMGMEPVLDALDRAQIIICGGRTILRPLRPWA